MASFELIQQDMAVEPTPFTVTGDEVTVEGSPQTSGGEDKVLGN